jgi:hypothetical protein
MAQFANVVVVVSVQAMWIHKRARGALHFFAKVETHSTFDINLFLQLKGDVLDQKSKKVGSKAMVVIDPYLYARNEPANDFFRLGTGEHTKYALDISMSCLHTQERNSRWIVHVDHGPAHHLTHAIEARRYHLIVPPR